MESQEENDDVVAQYKRIVERAEQIRSHDDGIEAIRKIRDLLDDTDKVVERVTTPREVGLDAVVLELSSIVIQQNAERLDAVFRPIEFADKLVNMLALSTHEGSQSEACIWTHFSEKFGYLLPLRPTFDYMYGTYDREGFKPKERAVRQYQRSKDYPKEVIRSMSEKGKGEERDVLGMQDILDLIVKKLWRIYKSNGKKPINYFEFILNPNSFEETCQNILNFSFLVRDSHVKMFTDDNELLIIPLKPKKDEMGGVQKEESKRQFTIQMGRKDWMDLVEVYGVKEAVIDFGLFQSQKELQRIAKRKS